MELLILLPVVAVMVGMTAWMIDRHFIPRKKKPLKPAQKPNKNWLAERLQVDLNAKRKAFRELSKEWQDEFTALVQKTCKHKYDMHARQWWVCTECKYEEPWYWDYGCSCATYRIETYGMHERHILTHRSGTCNLHGRDFEQYKAEALKWHIRQQQKYSKGGLTN